MSHNAEPAACDLLMEVEKLEHILNHVDRTNAQVHDLHSLLYFKWQHFFHINMPKLLLIFLLLVDFQLHVPHILLLKSHLLF